MRRLLLMAFGGGHATRAFRGAPGFVGSAELNTIPGGLLPGFEYPDSFVSWGPFSYVGIGRDCTVAALQSFTWALRGEAS